MLLVKMFLLLKNVRSSLMLLQLLVLLQNTLNVLTVNALTRLDNE